MGRALSLNYELELDGKTIDLLDMAEFTPGGAEGTIEAADGDVKYPIRDGIKVTEPVEVTLNVKRNDTEDIEAMEKWVEDASVKDAFIIGRDSGRNIHENYMFEECECVSGKKSASDKKSKSESTRKFLLLPKLTTPVK